MPHVVDTLFYLDAGTGTMLVQLAVAGAAGAAVAGKVGWAKVTSPFRRKHLGDEIDGESASVDRPPQSSTDD